MCKARCGSRVKLLRLKILHINNRAQTLISFLFNFLLFLNWAEIVADVLLHLLRHPHPFLHIFILFRIWGEHWWLAWGGTEPYITLPLILIRLILLSPFKKVWFDFPLSFFLGSLMTNLLLRLIVKMPWSMAPAIPFEDVDVSLGSGGIHPQFPIIFRSRRTPLRSTFTHFNRSFEFVIILTNHIF